MGDRPIQIARKALGEYWQKLRDTPVELQVRDAEHCKSQEVMTFCINHLKVGRTWEELRFRLGLGPAHLDSRWRLLRKLIIDIALPEDETAALKLMYEKNEILIERVERFLLEIEERMLGLTGDDIAEESKFYKVRLEALQTILQNNENKFQHYLNMKKLKVAEKQNRGVSIVFVTQSGIARPEKQLGEGVIMEAKQVVKDE